MEGNCQGARQGWQERTTTFSFTLTHRDARIWEQIAREQNIDDHSQLAAFLLRHYEQTRDDNVQTRLCVNCNSQLSHYCPVCFANISAEHLKVSSGQTPMCPSLRSNALHTPDIMGSSPLPVAANITSRSCLNPAESPGRSETLEKTDLLVEDADDTTAAYYDDDTNNEYYAEELEKNDDTNMENECENEKTKPSVVRKESSQKQDNMSGDLMNSKTLTCEICQQCFFDPGKFVIHIQVHSDSMHHECGECKAKFFQPGILELHRKSHSQQKKYSCDQCNAVYSRLDTLAKHKELKHQNQQKIRKSGIRELIPNEETVTNSDIDISKRPKTSTLNQKLNNFEQQSLPNLVADQLDLSDKLQTVIAVLNRSEEHLAETVGSKFSCIECGKEFLQKHHLERHSVIHTGEKCFGCQQCGAAFVHLRSLVCHMRTHYRHKPFLCGQCRKSFTSLTYFNKHVRKHSSKKFSCRHCGKEFITSGQLLLHSCSHEDKVRGKTTAEAFKETVEKCQEESHVRRTRSRTVKNELKNCTGHSNSKKALDSKNSDRKAYKSKVPDPIDQSTFPKEEQVETDQDTHPHCCQYCGSRFMFLNHLTLHIQDHTLENAFKCSQCNVSFRSRFRLTIHMRSHGSTEDFRCQYCGKMLRSLYTLKEHLRSHTGERPFKCDVCGACFTLRSTYKAHLRMHSGDRPYLCPHCGKSFVRSSNLSVHIRACTGEKPYTCSVCGKSFSDVGYYKKHVNNHAGIRPYKCEYCGKAFSQSTSLKLHIRIHTGEKPYKCDQCPKAFAIPNSLTEHMRKHTGDKPYKCSICGKGFAKSCNRLAHFRTHSKNKLIMTAPQPTANSNVNKSQVVVNNGVQL